MKRPFSALLLLFFTLYALDAFGQQEIVKGVDKLLSSRKSVGLTVSFGGDDLFSSEDIEGGPSYSGRGLYSMEAHIAFKLTDHIDLVPGVSFTCNSFDVAPAYRPTLSKRQNINVLSIPVYARYHFFKYLYISGGPTFNINGGDRDLNGIGAGINFGGEFNMSNGMLITFGPFIRYQGLLPWKNYKLSNRGIALGIGYRF